MPRTPRQPATPLIRSFATAKRLKWSADNVYNAVGALNRLEAWLAARDSSLKVATTDDLNEYLGWRLDQVVPNTVIGERTHIRAFYRWASSGDDPYLARNPAKAVETIKGNDPDPDLTHVTAEWEYRALLATCRRKTRDGGRRACDRRDAAIITLMWETGLRRAEVTRIEMRHIDWDAATIHLARTKGRTTTQSRDIDLGDEAMEAITRHVHDRGEHDGFLFESIGLRPGTTQRRPLAPNSIGLMLRRRADEANATQQLPGKVRPVAHGFRRASTINDIDDGISARAIQHQKGWNGDGRMLGRYTRLAVKRQSLEEYRAKRGRRHLRAVDDVS